MRHSTQEEKDAYEAMLERKSVVLASEEFERLEAENAKLQEAIVMHALNNGMLVKCVTDMNDALKELVQDFASFAKHVMNQWGVELEAGYATDAPPAEWKQCLYELDMLVERMRKLGIEV